MALWTPDPNDPVLWLSAEDLSTVEKSGDALISLADKSSQQKHATTHSAAAQPTHGVQTLNGHPVIRFNGSSNVLRGDWAGQTFPITILMLYREHAHVDWGRHLVAAQGADNATTLGTSGSSGTRVFASTDPGGRADIRTAPLNTWGVTTAWVDQKTDYAYHMRINGAVPSTGTNSTVLIQGNVPAGKYSLGGRWDAAFSAIDVAEVILYDYLVSAEELQKIEGYLAHKWGLAASLPAEHPYKDSAPMVLALFDGTITDKDGNPAERRITVLDATGHCVATDTSDPVTGAYSIDVPNNDPYTLVFDGEPDRNAQVFANVIPGEPPA